MTFTKENLHNQAVKQQTLSQGEYLKKTNVLGEDINVAEGCQAPPKERNQRDGWPKNRLQAPLWKSGKDMNTDEDNAWHKSSSIPTSASALSQELPSSSPLSLPDHANTNTLNRGRVAIFIDGSNLFYAASQLGIEIDYSKLLNRLTGNASLLRAFFYTGVDPANERQQGFLLWMRRNGYRVIAKDLVQFPDGSKKANLDVEIAVDMMALASHYNTAVLVSGDGDMAYAVNAVSYRGARVEVVSLRSMTSDSLIDVADCYIDLDAIKPDIQKASNLNYTYRPLPDYNL